MVFSVQQGEHGPLVVYKLEVPKKASPAAPQPAGPFVIPADRPVAAAPPARPTAPPPRRLSPLKPTVLGTVVMPAARQPAIPQPATPAALPSSLPLPLLLPEPAANAHAASPPVFRTTAGTAVTGEHMINEATGETLTLDEVTDAVEWRRDTAERLNTTPGAFGF